MILACSEVIRLGKSVWRMNYCTGCIWWATWWWAGKMKWKMKWCDPLVTQNQVPGQKPIQTMVRSMATQNHQHFPETMWPHIQDQEVNNNNINNNNSSKKAKVAVQNKIQSRKRIPLAPPFSFHYTFEAPDYHNLDLELRATCGRYNSIKLRSQQISRPVKVVELDHSNNKTVNLPANHACSALPPSITALPFLPVVVC